MDNSQSVDINIAIVGLDYNFVLQVSKLVADQLDMYFLDTIGLQEFDFAPTSLTEIIGNMGLPYFREKQSGTISYVSSFNNTVIAVESGAFLQESAVEKLNKCGLIIYIHQQDKILAEQYAISKYESEILERFYHINSEERENRDKILQKVSEIIVDASTSETIRCAGDIVKEIKKYYGVTF